MGGVGTLPRLGKRNIKHAILHVTFLEGAVRGSQAEKRPPPRHLLTFLLFGRVGSPQKVKVVPGAMDELTFKPIAGVSSSGNPATKVNSFCQGIPPSFKRSPRVRRSAGR